jgi:hypothetical protein
VAIEILDTWLTSSLASGGTITFNYPSGRTAASYTQADEVLMIPAVGRTIDDPVVTYGASNITVAYTGATLAANTTNGALSITGTGEASHTIQWIATTRITQVS